ncbi:hypothetical protein BDK51DRAFT_28923 [Blyttiomyces helicus]|uniref:Uncharacterized protein n=1 Tax=Blyttiomyces helicus TaxID=388810 RepID=A0A4V1ISJ4_9FUNG|nr:hypothetical protein BDK51DRAFT_28923 [Blyttiomyces helicus]|eukprot:RKO93767.1 hypothetical protein BDK51DRAFT_28923 [Blyttiomyces helicus]
MERGRRGVEASGARLSALPEGKAGKHAGPWWKTNKGRTAVKVPAASWRFVNLDPVASAPADAKFLVARIPSVFQNLTFLYAVACSNTLKQTKMLDFTLVDHEPAVLGKRLQWKHWTRSKLGKGAPEAGTEKYPHDSTTLGPFTTTSREICLELRVLTCMISMRARSGGLSGLSVSGPLRPSENSGNEQYKAKVKSENAQVGKGAVLGGARRSPGSFPNAFLAHSESNDRFSLHYGACPLDGFHLAAAFATLKDAKGKCIPAPGVADIVGLAKKQFVTWAKALGEKALSGYMIGTGDLERVVWDLNRSGGEMAKVGDVFDMTTALSDVGKNGTIRGPPSAFASRTKGFELSPNILDPEDYGSEKSAASRPAPTAFDVIDTSNLTDHLGLLNILVATGPLLKPVLHAILHTDSLIPVSYDGTLREAFEKRACIDLSLLSALTGLAPSIDLFAWCPRSSLADDVSHGVGSENQSLLAARQKAVALSWRSEDVGNKWCLTCEDFELVEEGRLNGEGDLAVGFNVLTGTLWMSPSLAQNVPNPMQHRFASTYELGVYRGRPRTEPGHGGAKLAGVAPRHIAFDSVGSATLAAIGAKVERSLDAAHATMALAPLSLSIGDS